MAITIKEGTEGRTDGTVRHQTRLFQKLRKQNKIHKKIKKNLHKYKIRKKTYNKTQTK